MAQRFLRWHSSHNLTTRCRARLASLCMRIGCRFFKWERALTPHLDVYTPPVPAPSPALTPDVWSRVPEVRYVPTPFEMQLAALVEKHGVRAELLSQRDAYWLKCPTPARC